MVKIFQTIRNNWKKSVFFTIAGAYGVKYCEDLYKESLWRKKYCRKALEFGLAPLPVGERTRKVTVFLNPAAQKGKAKKLFDKNVAPLLNLAGLELTVVKTEYEGQAKKYMDVVENTDAIIVAGGDGTVCEVITGILRRPDQSSFENIPIGVIPLGYTNTLAHSLAEEGKSTVRWLSNFAMSVINSTTKKIDVMCIEGNEGKKVFAVNSLQWGAYQDAENSKQKYWYVGPLKHRWTYIMSVLKNWPPNVEADFNYEKPCEGCSKCYVPPPPVKWKWWNFFLQPKKQVPEKEFKTENPECGIEHSHPINGVEFRVLSNSKTQKNTQNSKSCGMEVVIEPSGISRSDFIKEGWSRMKSKRSDGTPIEASSFMLNPKIDGNQESWFMIDNEQFEAMQVKVTLLKNKLKIFYPDDADTDTSS